MVLHDRNEIDIGERIAVDDQKRRVLSLFREQRQRAARSARRAEDRRLPGIADAHAEIAAIANMCRQRVGEVVQVEYRVGDTRGRKRRQYATNDRNARDRQCGFRADERQRPQAGGQPRGQDERRDHSSANTMFAPCSPNSVLRARKSPRYESRMKSSGERPSACVSVRIARSPPSISTKVPIWVSSRAIVASSAANSSRNF